ncbi:MAG: TetR/AcrR family transcriptional regulator [Myxococcota bacterium]|nr:TetR/AcrR family transcriptional regulator [Myxococcota bacterium]
MSVKPALRGDAARMAILDAAHVLFSARGVDAVTMAEVAEAAGVARATVFNHFGSKHSLVQAITEGVYDGYTELLKNALAERTTPTPVLIRALFEIMGGGIESDPGFYRGVFREIALLTVGLTEGGVAHEARQLALDRLVQLLTRGQARDELTREHTPEDLAMACDSLVFGTITHWLYDDASESLKDRMRRASDVFLGNVALVSPDAFEGPVPEIRVPPRSGPLRVVAGSGERSEP